MRRMRTLSIAARLAILGVILAGASAAATGAVILPSHANSHATDATSNVTTGPSATPSDHGTPNAHADFGQCVAANAKNASDNGGQGWNPTQGCDKPGHGSENSANESSTRPAPQSSNANDAAADGLSTAAAGGDNGASHANANGSGHAAARAGNATR